MSVDLTWFLFLDACCQLLLRSDAFRSRWAAHDVRLHRTGRKRDHHPVVGDLAPTYGALELPADAGLTVITTPPNPAPPPRTR
jgi:hypothetical protein